MPTKTRTLKEGVQSGILPKNLAFEAVQRELCDTAIVAGCEPLDGPFSFTIIHGHPTTKWSGRPIYVVQDHGQCRFSVAFTSDPEQLESQGDPFYSSNERVALSDMGAFEQDRLAHCSDKQLREEIQIYQKSIDRNPENAYFLNQTLQELRTILRVRHHRRKQKATE